MSKVNVGDLVTYARMAEICSDVLTDGDAAQQIRRWRNRGHISPVRPDLAIFDWTEVRPVIVERLGLPADTWADVEVYPGA